MDGPGAIWNPASRLLLASKSAARAQLLREAGIPFDVEVAQVDERAIEADFLARGSPADALASALARAKALEASSRNPASLCLGADQVLTFEGGILHKADNMSEARLRLGQLAGKTHRLISAFAIARGGEVLHRGQDAANMTMRRLDADQIARYVECAGPGILSSVGLYQLEALGVHLFERVEGDHSTILGLPLLKLLACLRGEGALLL